MNLRKQLEELYFILKVAKERKIDIEHSEIIIERKRAIRRKLKMEEPEYFESEDGGSAKTFYTVEYDGSKEDLHNELWANARHITSQYDCTGEVFTQYFIVGHLRDNIYRVCEVLGRDI